MEYKVGLPEQIINHPTDEVSTGERLISRGNKGKTQKQYCICKQFLEM